MFSRRFEGGFYLVIVLTEVTSLDLGVRSVPPRTRLLAVFVLDGIWVQGQWPSDDCAGEVSLLEGVATHVEWRLASLILALLDELLTVGLAACSSGVREILLNYNNVPPYLLQCSGPSKPIRLKLCGAYCAVWCWNFAAERISLVLGLPPRGAGLQLRRGNLPLVQLDLR